MNDQWQKRSKVYDKLNWTNREEYMASFLKMCDLKSNYCICDVGTGTGTIANSLSDYCSKINAIDISEDMLKIARDNHNSKNISYKIMDAEHLDFKPNTFDCVTARMCFHHIKNQKKAVKNCYEILKPHGKFVISEGIPPNGARSFYTEMFKLKEKRRTYTLDSLVELVEYGGFKKIDFLIHKMPNVSINNWLENSGLDKKTCKKIYNMHLDSPDYIKKVYNMRVFNGDIYMDWLFAIVSGVKL